MAVRVVLLALVASARLLGQATLSVGVVRGTVQDESRRLVAGARITLTEESKGLVRESTSDRSGFFLFPAVIAAVYSVQVEKQGFNTERMRGLRIEVAEEAFINMTLHVGKILTVVNVPPPTTTKMDTKSNTIGSVVDSNRVEELPLNGRNLLDLALLAGGTVSVSPASSLFTTNVGPPDRTIVLPGTLPNSVTYFLNGINVTGSRDGELAVNPSIAATDQFKVQENFLMPDQGSRPAAVNIVTKSGTNRFHGEAFEFLRNTALDAKSFFATNAEDVKLNQFGVASGGPLRRNRAWFYAFYEGLRECTAFSTGGYSPTAAMFTGDFSATGHLLFDPLSFDAKSGTRQPFRNAIIPPSRINPVARKLLEYYVPGSGLANIPNNISGNPQHKLDGDQGGLRVDAEMSDRSQLFIQIFAQNTPSDEPGLYPLSGLQYQNGSQLAMLHHVWALSPKAVNTLRIGFLRAVAIGGNEGQALGPILPSIGIMNTFETHGVSAINLQGYSSFGRSNGEIGNRDNTWQLDDEFMYTVGSHSFAFGAQLRYRRGWHLNGNSQALGTLSFQPAFTAQLVRNPQGQLVPLTNTGDSFADFLLGDPVSGNLLGLPVVQFRATQFAPFFQDSWRLRRNLTLNYGFSWFLDTPPNPQGWARNLVHGFDSATGLLTYAALGQMSSQAVATDKNNFAPRVGLAWSPESLKATVFRVGAGVYYSEFPWVLAPYPLEGGSPVGAGVGFANPLTNPLPSYVLGTNIFPPAPTNTNPAKLGPGTSVTAINPGFRTAYVSQWNLSIQHSFSRSDSVELNYLGSSGHRLPNVSDLSQCRSTRNLFCDPVTRPWPQYRLLLYADSTGNSSYEALIAKYDHNVISGLNLRFEYAFAKALTDTWQSSLTIYNQISDCRSCSKGPATFDVHQSAAASLVWEIPFDRGWSLPAWAHAAARNWIITAITRFSSGQPVMLTAPNQSGSALINPLPDRVCDGRSDQLSGNIRNNGFLWFNTSCFPVPPVGYFGNSGPAVLYGPGLDNWDIGVQKSFVLPREIGTLQLRTELFNAWNHTQFEQPNGNAGAGANFGRISGPRPPRLIQVALKLLW
ncbi:MAG: carboxypeptidase-like regulatory domain-containing protein [Bryobacteraceae bacterium]